MKRLIVSVALLVSLADPLHAAVFSPSTKTLENGLQVIVVENHMAPVVTHMMWVKAGAADEPFGKSGIAHYLEHLMFKSTRNRKAGTYSDSIARVGGTENAFTSYDYTAYFATVARENLPLVMELEADRFQNLLFKPEEAKPELDVVMDEKRQRVDSSPLAPFSQQLNAALHPHHPYGVPVIGWPEEIKALTPQDAENFYKAWYRPNNAVLVVSGDVKADEVFKLAAEKYGSWKRSAVPSRARVINPDFKGAMRIDYKDLRAHEAVIQIMLHAPSRRMDAKISYALEVLQEILTGSEAAYLPELLVTQKKLLKSIDIDYDADVFDQSEVSFSLVPVDNIAAEKILPVFRAALEDFSKKPLDEKILAAAKQSLQRAAILARDSNMGPAYAFGMALTTGSSVEEVEAWPDRIAAVTADDIANAMKLILDARQVVGVVTATPVAAGASAPPAPAQPQEVVR